MLQGTGTTCHNGTGSVIWLEDLAGAHWGMGNRGRPNMSAKALRRSCASLVLALPLGGLALPLADELRVRKEIAQRCSV